MYIYFTEAKSLYSLPCALLSLQFGPRTFPMKRSQIIFYYHFSLFPVQVADYHSVFH